METEPPACIQSDIGQDTLISFFLLCFGLRLRTQTHRSKLLISLKGNWGPDLSRDKAAGKTKSDFVSQAFIHSCNCLFHGSEWMTKSTSK